LQAHWEYNGGSGTIDEAAIRAGQAQAPVDQRRVAVVNVRARKLSEKKAKRTEKHCQELSDLIQLTPSQHVYWQKRWVDEIVAMRRRLVENKHRYHTLRGISSGVLDHNRSKQSILVWVWICVGALRVVEGRL